MSETASLCRPFASLQGRVLAIVALIMLLGQGTIIVSQTITEDAWRHDSALEVNRALTTLMASQAGRAMENGDEADLEAIYFDVAVSDAASDARAFIAALGAYDRTEQRIKSYLSLQHLTFDEDILREAARQAQETGEMVYRDVGMLQVFAAPVFTSRGGRELVGSLAIAWDITAMEEQLHAATLRHGAFAALAALAVLGVLLLLLRHAVLAPVGKLTRHVLAVQSTGALRQEASAFDQRADEIGVLFREFNAMLRQLADTRRSLLEQSYYTGLAEAASGVLHNIRNALNPIVVAAWSLGQTAEGLEINHLDTALDQLDDASTLPERRGKLVAYLRQSGARLREARTAIAEQADLVTDQVNQIERILHNFSRRHNPLREAGPIDLRRIVEDATRLVRQRRGESSIRVEIDDSIDRAPPLLGHEIVLAQILGNLVVNAGEAIAAAPGVNGLIRIATRTASRDDRPMLCLEIADNGEGFEPALLDRLFERGFSTRAKEYGGIGLHWCANSAIAMGGALTAHSDGPGSGAVFQLWLPLAAEATRQPEGVA